MERSTRKRFSEEYPHPTRSEINYLFNKIMPNSNLTIGEFQGTHHIEEREEGRPIDKIDVIIDVDFFISQRRRRRRWPEMSSHRPFVLRVASAHFASVPARSIIHSFIRPTVDRSTITQTNVASVRPSRCFGKPFLSTLRLGETQEEDHYSYGRD